MAGLTPQKDYPENPRHQTDLHQWRYLLHCLILCNKRNRRNNANGSVLRDVKRKNSSYSTPYHKMKTFIKWNFNRNEDRKPGIKWAPLNVPLSRRLETLAIFIPTVTGVVLPFFSYAFWYYLLYSKFWWLGLLYTIYILNDSQVANRGGRRWEFLRNNIVARYICRYSPTKLVKTAELDPRKNYIAPTSPHGQMMFGASNCFLTDGNNFSGTFPGLTSYLAMVPGRFTAPFLRELVLFSGAVSSSEESITYLMDRKKQKGNFLSINLGGSDEVMLSNPDVYKVVVRNRKGYARVAIKTGASVVPVFCFGETRVYKTEPYPEGTFMRALQDKIRVITGIAPIPARGRGFFQYSFGMLMHRVPLTVVVGEPIAVKQNYEPTQAEIDALHEKYMQKLTELFETNKHKYEPDPNIQLILV